VVTNNGLGRATGAVAGDSFPAVFTGVTFTATQTGGAVRIHRERERQYSMTL